MDGQPHHQSETGFLFIGELAKQTGADPKTIRFYERAGLLAPPRHGRFRTYLAADVRRLRNVLMLRLMGVPIAVIGQIFTLAPPDGEVLASPEVAALLEVHLATLRSRLDELNGQIRQTAGALKVSET
jgi:DNA-binding transcriptional MerR regulator